MKKGDILVKIKDSGGFRPVGSKIEIIEVDESSVKILHLPKNETAILGNDYSYYGLEILNDIYKLTNLNK